jgi:hypothetical protein
MPRLKDKSLAPLPALAAQLQHLSLSGCRGVTNKSLPLLGQLTSLRSLELTGALVALWMLYVAMCCNQACAG